MEGRGRERCTWLEHIKRVCVCVYVLKGGVCKGSPKMMIARQKGR